MMQRLRKVAIAIMFGFLIVAFSLWGAGDWMQARNQQPLAKVGSVQVTQAQFRNAYQRTLRSLSQRTGRRITPDEARAFGLSQGVLQNLIQDAALQAEAQDLGLGLSQAGLDEAIRSNPAFQDESGKFSQQRFEQLLAQNDMSVPFFISEVRAELIRRQLRAHFEKGPVVPDVMLDRFNVYLNEERTVDYFTIGAANLGELPAPTPEQLQTYYNDRKSQFSYPERRKITALAVTPETVKAQIQISDTDLKAAYDSRPNDFGMPEKRKVELIPFQTKKAAQDAKGALDTGKDFLEVAQGLGFKQADVDLGLVSQQEFLDKSGLNEAAAKAVFALEKGKTSEPIEGRLAVAIARVLEVIPASKKTFEEVKDQLRTELETAKANELVARLTKTVEDDRVQGVPLADTAKKVNVALTELDVDRTGKGADGKPVTVPGVAVPAVADAAFKSDVGVENQAVRLQSGGYVWFDVTDIVKQREKTFEEAKAEVETGWKRDQLRDKVSEKARELVKRIEGGEKLADVAKSVNSEAKTSKPLKRNATEPGISQSVVSQAFTLAEGGAGSAFTPDGLGRTVFRLAKITPPQPLKEEAADGLRQQLAQAIAEDNVNQFIASIRARVGSTVDTRQLATAGTGAGDAEE
jgi:peptidyl-prolyl cis-trans isomerase D